MPTRTATSRINARRTVANAILKEAQAARSRQRQNHTARTGRANSLARLEGQAVDHRLRCIRGDVEETRSRSHAGRPGKAHYEARRAA